MILAPSVLSLDYSKFSEQLDILNKNVEWLHFDVMDGHFVPNISFGPDILNTFRRNSSLFMDVHLMISNPKEYIKSFVKAGADQITVHYESFKSISELKECLDLIHSYYIKAGVSIKPQTPFEALIPILNDVDNVLVMSVEPGFGGQTFMESSLDKIKSFAKYKRKEKLKYTIEVDGGINDQNAAIVQKVGGEVLVAGSFIFKGDVKRNIDLLYKGKKQSN